MTNSTSLAPTDLQAELPPIQMETGAPFTYEQGKTVKSFSMWDSLTRCHAMWM